MLAGAEPQELGAQDAAYLAEGEAAPKEGVGWTITGQEITGS